MSPLEWSQVLTTLLPNLTRDQNLAHCLPHNHFHDLSVWSAELRALWLHSKGCSQVLDEHPSTWDPDMCWARGLLSSGPWGVLPVDGGVFPSLVGL